MPFPEGDGTGTAPGHGWGLTGMLFGWRLKEYFKEFAVAAVASVVSHPGNGKLKNV